MKKTISLALICAFILTALVSCTTECAHEWGEWEERVAPTCQKVGELVKTCAKCGVELSEEIARIDHAWTNGVCSVCGEKLYENSGTSTTAPDEPEEDPFDFLGEDLTKYLTLGAYKDLTVTVDPVKYLTEAEFYQQLDYELIYYGYYTEKKTGSVLKTDIVSLTYEGYVDGVKFAGGTGESEYFTVYDGGGFIDGFADGVVGAEVGKTVDVNVVFPENYHSADLAGKPAVFKVTVQYIYEADELTDDVIKEMSGGTMTSAKEFIEAADKLMREDAENTYKLNCIDALWALIAENVTVIELPQKAIDQYYGYEIDYYSQYALQYGMTLDKFLEANGITKDDIMKQVKADVLNDTIIYSVMKAESTELSDEEYAAELKDFADAYQTTVDEVLKYYEKDELVEMFKYNKTYESVLEWNTCVDK